MIPVGQSPCVLLGSLNNDLPETLESPVPHLYPPLGAGDTGREDHWKPSFQVSHLQGANLSKTASWGPSPLMVRGSKRASVSPADYILVSGTLSLGLPWRVN